MDQLVSGGCMFSDIVWFCNIIKQAMHPEESFFFVSMAILARGAKTCSLYAVEAHFLSEQMLL